MVAYAESVQRAVDDFRGHPDLTQDKVIRWLAQFSEENRATAAKALREIMYFQSTAIEDMTRQLIGIVEAQFPTINRKNILFVPVGSPGSGAAVIARHLRVIGVPERRIVDLLTLTRMDADDIDIVVFIDDFCGTGGKIKEWWFTIEQLVLPIQAEVVSGILLLNYRAQELLGGLFD